MFGEMELWFSMAAIKIMGICFTIVIRKLLSIFLSFNIFPYALLNTRKESCVFYFKTEITQL